MSKPTAIVRVHRPELTAEERAKRMEAIKQAAANQRWNQIVCGILAQLPAPV